MPRYVTPLVTLSLLLAGCAAKPLPVAVVSQPPVPVAVAPMPRGAFAGMQIPVRLADGGYDTPNRNLTAAATLWHFRAGLNVAVLACRGSDDATMIAGYNALLTREKAMLRDAEATLAGEYRATGGADWRTGYDSAMTRLYNYYALTQAHPAFCASATQILAEAPAIDPAAFPAYAAQKLAVLDRAFTDFYAAYDAWRGATRLPVGMTIATADRLPVAPGVHVAPVIAPVQVARAEPPRIELDMKALLAK